jgi:hypothetical protein
MTLLISSVSKFLFVGDPTKNTLHTKNGLKLRAGVAKRN